MHFVWLWASIKIYFILDCLFLLPSPSSQGNMSILNGRLTRNYLEQMKSLISEGVLLQFPDKKHHFLLTLMHQTYKLTVSSSKIIAWLPIILVNYPRLNKGTTSMRKNYWVLLKLFILSALSPWYTCFHLHRHQKFTLQCWQYQLLE